MSKPNTKNPSLLYLDKKAISELIAALMLFVITITISSISIAFLAQRASITSKSMEFQAKRASLISSASVKLIDVIPSAPNRSILLLYNPLQAKIRIAVLIVGSSPHYIDEVLNPMNIKPIELNLSSSEIPQNEIYILTAEGVLIHVKP